MGEGAGPILQVHLGGEPVEEGSNGLRPGTRLPQGVVAVRDGVGPIGNQGQPPVREGGGDQAVSPQQHAVPLDGRVDRQARLVQAQAAAHVPHRHPRRVEVAAPGRKRVARLVVVDEGQFGQGGLPSRSQGRQQCGSADREDLLVHQVLDLEGGMVVGAADRNVERAVVEVAGGDHGREADVDLGRFDEEALELGHQPERGDGGGRRDRDLLTPLPTVQGKEGRLELVEPLRELLQGARRRRREGQPPPLAVEQGRSEEVLERPDLMADGRRGDAKLRCGPCEAQVTGGRLKRSQGIQGKIGPHTPSSDRCRPSTPRASHPPPEGYMEGLGGRVQKVGIAAPKR